MTDTLPHYPEGTASELTVPPPSTTTRTLCVAGILGAWGLTAWVTQPNGFTGGWIAGLSWYWICLGLWAATAALSAVLARVAWRRTTVVLLVVALTLVVAAWSQGPTSSRIPLGLEGGAGQEPRSWFADHRTDFEEAVRYADSTCCVDDYLGDPLPDHLQYLTVNGKVTGDDDQYFFAQWFGIPDDAGGFWYSPAEAPVDYDMFGMLCRDPVDLGKGWWMCGM